MSFGQNLQFLRKMGNGMTQEELAEKLGVSRQTISKYELDMAYPELEKVIELCNLFSCTMDQLVREDINICDEAYSDIREEVVEGFYYVKYAVISAEPEEDAINHVRGFAENLGINEPDIIGWDFPVLSQEQINVYNLHGYEAALIIDNKDKVTDENMNVIFQEQQKYMAITIDFSANKSSKGPFILIPNAYKMLMTHMKLNGIKMKCDKKVIGCFEREYVVNGTAFMDIFIAVEN